MRNSHVLATSVFAGAVTIGDVGVHHPELLCIVAVVFVVELVTSVSMLYADIL